MSLTSYKFQWYSRHASETVAENPVSTGTRANCVNRFGMFFCHIVFFLGIGQCSSQFLSVLQFAKNHQILTDFGPVYSENRLMVVVVLGPDTYTTLPFYTNSGNGTALKHGKDDYVSVQDHRDRRSSVVVPEMDHRSSRCTPLQTGMSGAMEKSLMKWQDWLPCLA